MDNRKDIVSEETDPVSERSTRRLQKDGLNRNEQGFSFNETRKSIIGKQAPIALIDEPSTESYRELHEKKAPEHGRDKSMSSIDGIDAIKKKHRRNESSIERLQGSPDVMNIKTEEIRNSNRDVQHVAPDIAVAKQDVRRSTKHEVVVEDTQEHNRVYRERDASDHRRSDRRQDEQSDHR